MFTSALAPLPAIGPTLTSLPPFWRTVRLALAMDADIYTLAQTAVNGLAMALLIMLLAAMSEAVGQSMVLLLNRVRPWRWVLAVGLAIVSNIIGYLLWSLVIWLSVRLVFGVEIPFVAALIVVGLAYAPQLLAFFEMAPYFGNFFGLALTLWTMAAIVIAIRWGFGLEIWQAALSGLLSWLVIQLWRRSLGQPIYALGRWMTRGAAGQPLAWSLDDVVEGRLHREQYSSNWKEWRRQWAAQRQAQKSQRAVAASAGSSAVGVGAAVSLAPQFPPGNTQASLISAEDTDDLPAVPLPAFVVFPGDAVALPASVEAVTSQAGVIGHDRGPG